MPQSAKLVGQRRPKSLGSRGGFEDAAEPHGLRRVLFRTCDVRALCFGVFCVNCLSAAATQKGE